MAQQNQKPKIILLLSLLTCSLFNLLPAFAAEDFIKKSCKASLYPDLCYTSLSPFAGQVQESPEKLAAVSITLCLSKVQPLKSHVQDLSKKATEPKLSGSLKQCVENFDDTVDNIRQSIEQFKNIGAPGAIGNVQTWMSSVLTDEDTCLDGLKGAPDGPGTRDVVNHTDEVEKITSISLAMINLFANS